MCRSLFFSIQVEANFNLKKIDGRGSAYEGDKFMQSNYRKLGQYEPVDQVEVAQHIINSHSFIDQQKTAIYGWSYGGYATSHTLGYDGGKVMNLNF